MKKGLDENGVPLGYIIWHPTNKLRWVNKPAGDSNIKAKLVLQQKWFCEYELYGEEWRDVPIVKNGN